MITTEKLNAKAFQELMLYYLEERITHKNLELKHLVITNIKLPDQGYCHDQVLVFCCHLYQKLLTICRFQSPSLFCHKYH